MGQFQPNLAQSILRLRKFKSIHMEGQDLFQGERIMKYQKFIDEINRSSLGSLGQFDQTLWREFKLLQIRTIRFLKRRKCVSSIFIKLIIAFCKCVLWFEVFLRWAMWPMGLLFSVLYLVCSDVRLYRYW